MQLKSNEILAARQALAHARHSANLIMQSVINKCKHEHLGECEYAPSSSTYGLSSPPRRICLHCGLTEDGWSCGYVVLSSASVMPMHRDEINQMQTVHVTTEDEGPLIRKEKTLKDIVKLYLGI